MFTKRFERRIYIAVTVALSSGLLGFSFFLYAMWPANIVTGYEPDQPINFSHKLHAGEMKISCVYCHSNVEKGAHATIPPISTCMNCHSQVHPNNRSGQPSEEINLLKKHWEEKTPIQWEKVNDVADFVYFNHSRHISSGVTCNECHGPIETMTVVRRQNSLKMGWCLDCHNTPKKQEVVTGHKSENMTSKDTEHLPKGHVATLPEGHPIVTKSTRAPINCSACHR